MLDFQLDFSSTAYLSLDRHPRFRDWVGEGFDRYGLHYGGSRYAPGAPAIYAEAEQALANWLGTETALLVSSGSLAAAWVRDGLRDQGRRVHFADTVHAAWLPDVPADARIPALRTDLAAGHPVAWLADSVDPIAVATTELPALLAHAASDRRCVVLDESHAIGILGEEGRGLAPAYRRALPTTPVLAVGSLGKALSLPAGFIAGPRALVDAWRASPRYGGAAPPNPAFLYAWLRAAELIPRQRQTLQARLEYFLRRVSPAFPLRTIPGHPALRCLAPAFSAFAEREGIRLSHFAYPSTRDEPVTRIVLRAGLSYAQLDTLLNAIERFSKEKD